MLYANRRCQWQIKSSGEDRSITVGGSNPHSMANVTTPEEYLGFRVGSDRKLADWPEVVGYLQLLDERSDRIKLEEIGRSTEDNPFLLCTISSPDNIDRLDEFRDLQQSLADPRSLSESASSDAVRRGRAVVAITCSIHATEVGGTQMALELAHMLASSKDSRVRTILDNVILLLVPSLNPDGLVRVRDWYNASVGTHFEGSIPPYLYHKYAGHDNNRDWFMFTQKETRLVVRHVHNAWRPHITFDIHQTRSDGMRMILPPLVDPIGPNVDPVLQSELAVLGTYMAAQLTAEGKSGVAVNVVYDSYSPSRSYPHYHGGVRVLSEAASVRIASPIKVSKTALKSDRGELPTVKSWNHPMPWPGGEWSLRDVVEYDLSASMACLEHAARNREWWVRNSYDVVRRTTRHDGNPFAYVIPARQHDRSAAAELTELLQFADVEVHEATGSAASDEVRIDPGDLVVLTRQPYGMFAQTMLERQRYPDIRQYPGGPPRRPYDATAHSLPLKMGVTCHEIKEPVSVDLTAHRARTNEDGEAGVRLDPTAKAFAIRPESNASSRVVNKLLFGGHAVFRTSAPLPSIDGTLPPGTWICSASPETVAHLGADSSCVEVEPVWDRPAEALRLMRPPRIGLYASYVPSIEEGWTRFVFDSYGFRYVSLVDADIHAGELEDMFDCIILPHQTVRQIHRGFSRAHYSSKFSGGLGDRGIARLTEFVERGGTLIAWDDSARFLVRHLELPVTNRLARLSDSEFFAPGSLLRIEIDTDHPIGYGMPKSAAALFMNGPAYEVAKGSVVAQFPKTDALLSGWLIGEKRITGLAALTSVPKGLGQVVLFGFRPHFRAQARGTYKLLFNAIYNSSR